MAAKVLFIAWRIKGVKSLAKIVHVISELVSGGGQTLLLSLARESAKRHDVTVISLTERCTLDTSGLHVITLKKRPGFDLKTIFALYRTLRRLSPDVVHTHLYAALYAVPWFWMSKRRRGVHTIHSDAEKELPRLHRWLQSLLYHRRGVVPVAISRTIQAQAEQLYRREVRLIWNAVDIGRFRCPARNYQKRIFTFVQVATFQPWKNQRLLLDAFYDAYQDNRDLRLVFAGDGPERRTVMEAARAYGIDGAVTFLGNVAEVAPVLQAGDAFVLSSQYEGLPMALLEAFASGMPVISTKVGGVADVVCDGKNGLLVPPGDRAALAAALRALSRDRALCARMSAENVCHAAEFDIRKAARQYERLYLE